MPKGEAVSAQRADPKAQFLREMVLRRDEPYDPDAIRREYFDRLAHSLMGRMGLPISPPALGLAYADWLAHLAVSPGKQAELATKIARKWVRFANYATRLAMAPDFERCIEPLPHDKRFRDEAWTQFPFNLISQSFLLCQQWWHGATTHVSGVTRQHENVVNFVARQWLDMLSPSNFLLTNPEALRRTYKTGGLNLALGWWNFLEDSARAAEGKKPVGADEFRLGLEVATTPGKVVFRNRLIELIQYEPTTGRVYAEPLLIVPAWIMKYYILDLSPQNSLVRYLLEQGFTVFMISWKNPGPEDRELSMEDYLNLGVRAALQTIAALLPQKKIHAVGYCLGGTLLAIAAAAMGRDRDERLATLTLLAAQTDFTEAGELTLFVNESQLAFLDDIMWAHGYLETKQMAGAFQLLRSNDLIWSYALKCYLLGERAPMSDLMAWNADATRMPYRMHSEYLRSLFLNNDLAEGRLHIDGKAVALHNIHAPIFAVGAERDHVAPWRSVFKIHLLTETDVTFLLASGPHNAGIVSPPEAHRGGYRVLTSQAEDPYLDPADWREIAAKREGSWWPEWVAWLDARSTPGAAPPPMAKALCSAPGTYVLQQ